MSVKQKNRILSFVLALAVTLVSLPLSLFTSAQEFVSENAMLNNVKSMTTVVKNLSSGSVYEHGQFNGAGAVPFLNDGDTATVKDIYGANDWGHNSGILIELNSSFYAGEVRLYSGFAEYPDTYDVYASDSLDTIYSESSKVGDSVLCTGTVRKINVNKKVKYIAVFLTDYTYNGRIAEIELWTAEESSAPLEPEEFVPSNVLRADDVSIKTVVRNISNGTVSEHGQFNRVGAVEILNDGDTSATRDAYGANDWGHNSGVVFELSAAVYAGEVRLYSGFEAYPDTYDVYASDTLDTLYNDTNKIGDDVVCTGGVQKLSVNRKVQYLAVLLTDYTYNGRIAEIELWTAEEPDEEPEYDTDVAEGGKKVLTIGNSFSENASAYATAIAANQGYDLLFGYLKYPSCTIEQHIKNAEGNRAVYKFEYTGSMGRVTVKDGVNSFATVREALTFTDWDIVVLQEGSTASESFNNYLNIEKLINYVKELVPDAEIMLHETWSWGIWGDLDDGDASNDHSRCNNIIANYVLASQLLCSGAKIIHSGLAIESAREYYNDHLMFNDLDGGNYQHLNDLGKYIAGVTYVATIFGCDITQNTYGDGLSAFERLDLPKMREMIAYVVGEGDKKLLEELKPLIDEMYDSLFGEPDNFIRRHLDSYCEIIKSVKNGSVNEHSHFSAANSDASMLAIDGDTMNTFDVWGALDWWDDTNNVSNGQYVGVMYTLDGCYKAESVKITAGLAAYTTKITIYASDSMEKLYDKDSIVAENISCSGQTVVLPVGREIRYIAFIVTDYDRGCNTAHIAEFDIVGSKDAVIIEPIVWPQAPAGDNILKNAAAAKIIAPGGDYKGTKEFEYRLMDQQTEVQLATLTDGSLEKHYDVWSLSEKDRPGVLYDLGAYYDLTHLHAWAGAYGSQLIVNNGYKIYASENLSDLYKDGNLVLDYSNGNDTTNEAAVNVSLKRIRYVAFLLVQSSDGGWRMREFAAYGTKSADQTEKAEPVSIIEGIEAEYYGVATDNLADPVYMGASNFVSALTDGSRDSVEFWGGQDVDNTSFVFIYDLYANYDLSGIDIYAFADSIEEDSGIHKGIKSAKVYASRKFDELFNTKPLVMKEGYADQLLADENSYYSADALSEWKNVRYIAYVFKIGDSRYGACRLEELKAFGVLSAVQDAEEDEAKLPQYIDIEADNGVTARIYALGANDDLSKLDAHLKSQRIETGEELELVNSSLENYKSSSLYKVAVVDGDGSEISTSGRIIRLSFPENESGMLVACVDDFGAEIISSGMLNNRITVETSTLRSYATVTRTASANTEKTGTVSTVWILIIALGVFAAGTCGGAVFVAEKIRRPKIK